MPLGLPFPRSAHLLVLLGHAHPYLPAGPSENQGPAPRNSSTLIESRIVIRCHRLEMGSGEAPRETDMVGPYQGYRPCDPRVQDRVLAPRDRAPLGQDPA